MRWSKVKMKEKSHYVISIKRNKLEWHPLPCKEVATSF